MEGLKIELYQNADKFEMLEDYREAFNLYIESAKWVVPRRSLP